MKIFSKRPSGQEKRETIAPEAARFQSAASVARLAKDMLEAGLETDYEELMPDYMRKAEAERRLEEKKK